MQIRTPRGSSSSTAATTPPPPTTESYSTTAPNHQKSLPQWRQNLLAVPEPLRCKSQRDLARAAELSDLLIETFSPTSVEPRPHIAGNSPQGIRCVLAALECEALSFGQSSILYRGGYPTEYEIYKSTGMLAFDYIEDLQPPFEAEMAVQHGGNVGNKLSPEQGFLGAAFQLWFVLASFWLGVEDVEKAFAYWGGTLKSVLEIMEALEDFDESALMKEHGSQLTRAQVVAMIKVLYLQLAFAAGQLDAAAWEDYCETLRRGGICWYSCGKLNHVALCSKMSPNVPGGWFPQDDIYEFIVPAKLRYIEAATTIIPPDPFLIAYLTLDLATCKVLSQQSATVGYVEGLLEKVEAAKEQCRPWMTPYLRKIAISPPILKRLGKCLARTREAAALEGKDCRSAQVLSPTEEEWAEVERHLLMEVVAKCAACGAEDQDMRLCSGCKTVHYCGRGCQAAHWKEHKKACKAAAAAAKAAAAE